MADVIHVDLGEGNELAQRLEELLKKEVPDMEPEDDFVF